MDNLCVKIRQLTSILFCDYRQSEKNACRILYSPGHRVPQRVKRPVLLAELV